MNFEPLEKNRLQALSEEGHSKSQVLIQRFLDKIVSLGDISMENKIEAIWVDRDLMCNFVLLIVDEIFQDLLLLHFVIPLANEAMSTTDLIVA